MHCVGDFFYTLVRHHMRRTGPFMTQRATMPPYPMPMFALAAVFCAACVNQPAAGENWTYVGNDKSLKAPTTLPTTEISREARLEHAQQALKAWQWRVADAVATAKAACAKETGESPIPIAGYGYGNPFLACMGTAGWARHSNPL